MMYKRPSKRVKVHPAPAPVRGTLPPGSFLGSIIHNEPPKFYERVKQPVYQQDVYLKALKKNYEDNGLPFKDPELPDYVEPERPQPIKEPELTYGDRVQVTFRILKSGIVRVKVNAAIADVYNKYYRCGKKPPFKTVLQAYKSHGFSKEFLEKIKMKNEKQKLFATKVEKILEKIFDKEPVKKPKKEKKKPVEEEEEQLPEVEEEEEDDVPEDEGGLDMELEVDEEVVEEEEYFSEPET